MSQSYHCPELRVGKCLIFSRIAWAYLAATVCSCATWLLYLVFR